MASCILTFDIAYHTTIHQFYPSQKTSFPVLKGPLKFVDDLKLPHNQGHICTEAPSDFSSYTQPPNRNKKHVASRDPLVTRHRRVHSSPASDATMARCRSGFNRWVAALEPQKKTECRSHLPEPNSKVIPHSKHGGDSLITRNIRQLPVVFLGFSVRCWGCFRHQFEVNRGTIVDMFDDLW